MDLPLPSRRQIRQHDRFLPVCDAQRQSSQAIFGKALNGLKDWEKPRVINTYKAPTYGIAIAQLKAEGKCPDELVRLQVKYLNNVVEADHGKLNETADQTG